MKVGFSGVGNMSSAIINGLLKQNLSKIASLHGFSPSGPKPEVPCHQSLQWHESNLKLAQAVDVLVLGVKPRMIKQVLQEIRDVQPMPLLVSLAAGVTTESMRAQIDPARQAGIIRTMPNTPSAVGAGMTGLYADDKVSPEHKQFLNEIFASIGEVLWLDQEEKFHVLTAVSGSGPAYFFQFTNALMQAGIRQGLTHAEAKTLAVHTARGAGLLMSETGKEPLQLQKEVTSPNGTTFAATEVFCKSGIDQLADNAVTAARQRSIELSQED